MTVAYEDLTLIDTDPVRLLERARGDITSVLPGWVPLEGDLATLLLEQFALMVAETVYAANQAPARIMLDVLALYGLVRDAGAAPIADLTFTVSTTGGERSIPAGTRVLADPNAEEPLLLTTAATLTLPDGIPAGTIEAFGDRPTSAFNAAGALPVAVVDSVAYLEGVTLSGTIRAGRDPETLDDYLDRGALMLSRLTSTLVRSEQFAAAAMQDPNVARAIALDLYDPGQTPPEDRSGHVTLALLGQSGAPLTPEQKETVRAALAAQAIATLAIHVVDATITAVDITVDVLARPGVLPADVKTSVTAVLRAYLDPAQWAFGDGVYVNELIAVIDSAPGVERVITIEVPAGDVALGGIGPVADLGELVVKVAGTVVP